MATSNGSAALKGPLCPRPVEKREQAQVLPTHASSKTRTKRKQGPELSSFTRWCVKHQIGLSMNLLALLGLTHFFFPKSRGYTTKFFSQSYYNPRTGEYGIGHDDAYQVVFYTTIFTALRAGAMDYLLTPLAKWWGISKRKTTLRFCEQGYLVLYYSVFWPMGMYIYCNSEYYLNLRHLWTNWPNREVSGVMRVYMLAQLAFWLQQILVINIEERRKDHWQMFMHHVVTIVLIITSWRFGYTRAGNFILILMDGVDIVFSIAKLLKYTGFHHACDVFFVLFMVSWFLARHVAYLCLCWSVYSEADTSMVGRCYRADNKGPFPYPPDMDIGWRNYIAPLLDSETLMCYGPPIKWVFLTFLLLLQAILLVWLVAIFRVALRVLRGASAEDSRSDGEEEDDVHHDAAVDKSRAVAVLEGAVAGHGGKTDRREDDEDDEDDDRGDSGPIEEEVGVEDIDLKGWGRRSGVTRQAKKKASSSTGVSLPGHSDRKEFLGRIGCEKQVD